MELVWNNNIFFLDASFLTKSELKNVSKKVIDDEKLAEMLGTVEEVGRLEVKGLYEPYNMPYRINKKTRLWFDCSILKKSFTISLQTWERLEDLAEKLLNKNKLVMFGLSNKNNLVAYEIINGITLEPLFFCLACTKEDTPDRVFVMGL